ncbi:hypothetical protein ACFY71_29400 [Streptomyces cinerochromogenes]|uniref:SbtR family transcriptional regulator n=1 Tax=Streptomyces cinerochromogenes TaxID=66422 RepID=UPI0036C53889
MAAVEELLLHLVEQRDMLVLPLIGGPVVDAPEAIELQRQIAAALEDLLATARSRSLVRPDVTTVDLITTAALACRPLPYLPSEQTTALATRHVRIFLDGLRPDSTQPLPAAPTHEEFTAHLRTAQETEPDPGDTNA